MIATNEAYKQKTALLKAMSYHYYVLDSPIASDEEYDALYAELKAYEARNPSEIDATSPTQRVGDSVKEGFVKVAHIEKMWSLDDIFNDGELESWITKATKTLTNPAFMCDAKFDGASLNLTYERGILVNAATRGDGSIGEAILANAKTIHSIPLGIPHNERIEIRGEVVITKSDFEALNNERLKNGEAIFANPRNAAAGSLRQQDARITAKRKLKFIPWGFGACNLGDDSFWARLEIIKSFGFIDTKLSGICRDIGEIRRFYEQLVALRHTYEIMLDGMVIRLDSVAAQNALGYTIKNPRFAVAYKFPPIEKRTKIQSVSFSVGRSGVITPVAELEPVEIEGATITRATLHNFDEIKRKDIRIGDNVLIIRSGDVIPKIIKPIVELRTQREIIVVPPTHCPICGSELLIEPILIKCQNLQCKARVISSIVHFCSKKAMDIDGMGEKIVEQLFEERIIGNVADIYKIRAEMLQNLAGWQEKKIANLLNAIESSKSAPLWRLINALGMEHIGEGASKILAKNLGLGVFGASVEELQNLENIGIESAESIASFIQTNAHLISELLHFITPQDFAPSAKSDKLSGEIIVISGTLSKPRDEIAAMLENLGATITSNVSKKTTLLIIGENPGSKLQKAQDLGVRIINESELEALMAR